MAAMNSPILSGAMVLTLSFGVLSAVYAGSVEYGGELDTLPLSQTVPVTWPRSACRTKQVWSSMRNVELDQLVFQVGASSKSSAGS